MPQRLRDLVTHAVLPGFPAGSGGLTASDVVVVLGALALALAAIQGQIGRALHSFGFGEDFFDVQRDAREALAKFAEEARWARRLVSDAEFFARSPAGTPPDPCAGGLCADSVNLDIPRGNPIVPDCAYFVRFAREASASTFTRQVKPDPDPSDNPQYGAGQCAATAPQPLAAHASALVLHYCDDAGTCTPPYTAVAPARVARLRGNVTITMGTGGATRSRTVSADVALRDGGRP